MSVSISCYYHNIFNEDQSTRGKVIIEEKKWNITEVKTTQTNVFC